ncbi:MAG: TolB family protein [Chloroflexota bacterium]
MAGKIVKPFRWISMLIAVFAIPILCCKPTTNEVPHQGRWGIYSLDLATQNTQLIYNADREIQTLRLNHRGDAFVFAQKMDGDDNEHFEINSVGVDGANFKRLTSNTLWDIYPAWSPDDSLIAFLSFGETGLDIYVMTSEGNNTRLLYDSGTHDADIDWVGDRIVFTSNSQVWTLKSNGTGPGQVTHPPRAGEWGQANLPFGDYDPRLSPDGTRIAFERLEGDADPHGNYNIYIVNVDGSGETRLTSDGYSQGFAEWSHVGDRILYIVAAINGAGQYDMYIMNADGTNKHNVTPEYFPADFLVHNAIFSKDDSKLYFIGEWWQ